METAQSFLFLAKRSAAGDPPTLTFPSGEGFLVSESADRRLQFTYRPRFSGTSKKQTASATSSLTTQGKAQGAILLGDPFERENSGQSSASSDYVGDCMGSAVTISYDLNKKFLRVCTSVIGLPSVFLFEDSDTLILTSDLHLLTRVCGLQLRFDLAGVRQLGHVGHPIDFRTLFRGVRLVAGGTVLEVDAAGRLSEKVVWTFKQERAEEDWSAFLEQQISAFEQATRTIDVGNSFLSLTAGLDTRAILSELIKNQRTLPAFTISGTTLSLDARIARELAANYGMKHEIISCSEDFCRRLPELVKEASRLSGGLASLGQAPQVFFYQSVGGGYSGRVSGYLGNQVGRGGAEKLSNRNADPAILHPDVRSASDSFAQGHWFSRSGGQNTVPDYQFLLQQEVPFSSVGNYNVGNHFVIEQSPYASRTLMELLPQRPLARNGDRPASVLQRRLNDLRHRFLGEPMEHSFQRTRIARLGGPAATCPINWGWRAKGGISPQGILFGSFTFLDAIAISRGMEGGLPAKPSGPAGIFGLHDYRQPKAWLDRYLKDFLFDVLSSQRVRESKLFDIPVAQRILDGHFSSDNKNYKALTFLLDLALAQETFSVVL